MACYIIPCYYLARLFWFPFVVDETLLGLQIMKSVEGIRGEIRQVRIVADSCPCLKEQLSLGAMPELIC